PWLNSMRDQDVLEVGCGVGRWTRMLAANGNRVTAIDLSPTMIDETRTRLLEAGLDAELHVADVASFDAGKQFDSVISVTVIQHVTDDSEFRQVFDQLARQLKPGGRAVLLEAAPTDDVARCDSPIFRARRLGAYTDALTDSGFRIDTITGVDPMPFKTWLLPYLRALPKAVGVALTALVTALSLPLDLLLARWLTRQSWHKLIVATRTGEPCRRT
ncbi:MAG: class I SAM-dependent methyltransferase, partial [Woeseiaceae bacterium]|nr:class I SAM-dependent methyltransferase [Woeseiaceae bacterium]